MRNLLTKVAAGAVTVAALSAAAFASQPASSQMFEYTYYSDATLTVQVGWATESCRGGQVVLGRASGTATQYYTTELIGRCPGGIF